MSDDKLYRIIFDVNSQNLDYLNRVMNASFSVQLLFKVKMKMREILWSFEIY